MMSANITAASTSWRRTGCSVTSAVSSADWLTSKKAWRSRIARYSGSERPACRMNHTGVRSTASRRAARTSNGSTRPRLPPMAKGPLAVRWGEWTLDDPHAGAVGRARVELENAGTVTWRDGIRLAYHWLDDRGNPIVWDGERTPLPALAPGERATVDARVRAPIPPGRYRFALDVVAEFRAWFSELGSDTAAAEVDVLPRRRHAARRAARAGSSRRRTRPSASRPRTPRATRSSPARSSGSAASASGARGALAAVRAGPRADPELRAPAALPVGAGRPRAGAARGRGGPAGLRRAGGGAVALRRPDRPARAPEADGATRLTDRSSIGTKLLHDLSQTCDRFGRYRRQ